MMIFTAGPTAGVLSAAAASGFHNSADTLRASHDIIGDTARRVRKTTATVVFTGQRNILEMRH